MFGDANKQGVPYLMQTALAAASFAEFLNTPSPVILVGMDTRPTSRFIAACAVQSLLSAGAIVRFAGVVAAPEIMAASHTLDGFVFVTASHNPVEHNGLKFGRQGAVLAAQENEKLSSMYKAKCDAQDAERRAKKYLTDYHKEDADVVYRGQEAVKRKALASYKAFAEGIIGDAVFSEEGFCVLADFNGGARALSIDKEVFKDRGVSFCEINGESTATGHAEDALHPVHGIIPEGENLYPLCDEMQRLHKADSGTVSPYGVAKNIPPVLGYMTDCDGDRGNIVYWDDEEKKACILQAQEVFALAVMYYLKKDTSSKKAAAINCATSARIDELASKCGAAVVRSCVGEANVENAAAIARAAGYSVPVAGEGSNGGLIVYPSKVRDPIMTVFALLSLLREYGSIKAALSDIPKYTTTGAAEERAIMHIKADKAKLKEVFCREWGKRKDDLKKKYGIASYDTALANGTSERVINADSIEGWDNGAGSVKVRFMNKDGERIAFLWLRKSGTEDLLRVMCDVKGEGKAEEETLLEWWRAMIEEAAGIRKER